MNNTIKNVFIFITGAGIGGAVTWFGMKNYFAHKTDTEIQKVKNFYEENYLLVNKERKEHTKESVNDIPAPSAPKVTDGEKEMIEQYRKVLRNTPYSKPDDIRVSSEEFAEREHPEEEDFAEPYPITSEEWGASEPYFDKVSLIYQRGGLGLIDAFTEVNVEPGDTIGEKGYDIVTDPRAHDGSLVFIRNEKLSVDYEIEIVDAGDDEDESEE